MMNRREFLTASGALAVGSALFSGQCRGSTQYVSERQKGDPDAKYERLSFDPDKIQNLIGTATKAAFEPWNKDFPGKLVATAESFLGVSRVTAPDQVTSFLQLFDLPFKDSNGPVPFCAAGISYCALTTILSGLPVNRPGADKTTLLRQYFGDIDHYYFYPTVSCQDMYFIAAGRHRWQAKSPPKQKLPKPGWIVLFDWSNTGRADHCGLITSGNSSEISTIEFNTSGLAGGSQRDGGTVSRKTRPYTHVKGFIITDKVPTSQTV